MNLTDTNAASAIIFTIPNTEIGKWAKRHCREHRSGACPITGYARNAVRKKDILKILTEAVYPLSLQIDPSLNFIKLGIQQVMFVFPGRI